MFERTIKLEGRVFITFDIQAVTGLHIGGSDAGVEIGGVDKTVIRDRLTNRPYIPGSSLKGKMRSLLEKYRGLKQNQKIGKGYIHSCGADYKGEELAQKGKKEYEGCDVCQVFGLPGDRDFATPTRLTVRDVFLNEKSAGDLGAAQTDLPYTEVKTEVSIDRVTSVANPRQMERVPAGAIFDQGEMIFGLYEGSGCSARKDLERLGVILEGMRLLEDDYLGGLGSRGSGKIRFKNIRLEFRNDPRNERQTLDEYPELAQFTAEAMQKACTKIDLS